MSTFDTNLGTCFLLLQNEQIIGENSKGKSVKQMRWIDFTA